MLDTIKQWDRELLIYLNNLGSTTFDGFWVFVTQIESWIPLFVFLIMILLYKLKRKKGIIALIFVLSCFGLTLLSTEIAKAFFERLRPNNDSTIITLIRVLQSPSNFGFFSGHASTSFAIVTLFVLVMRRYSKWMYLAFLWPLLFMYSRIYVGVHYPTDLLIGLLVGVIFASIFYKGYQRVIKIQE